MPRVSRSAAAIAPESLAIRRCARYALGMNRFAEKAAFAAVALGLTLTSFMLAREGYVEHQSFKAFYCAGVAVREHRDPYLVEPLRSCEHRFETDPMPQGYVEPAPLPGYALVPFALLSALPPHAAAELFAVLLALAAVVAAGCLAALLPAAGWAVLLALVPLTLLNVAYGETPPLALLAICAGAFLLSKERWTAAGCAVTLALVQPNVGLPAVLAIFIFARRTRIAVVVTGLALAALSFGALGVAQNREYFAAVLPLMAQAEIVASDQYSLSRLLYVAGLPPDTAMLLGKIWFAIAAVLGIWFAGVLARRQKRAELLPLLPPAAVLLLGIYLHDIQMLIALPAALAIAVRSTGATRLVAAAALAVLLAVWTQGTRPAVLALDALGVFGGLFAVLPGSAIRRVMGAASGVIATLLLLFVVRHLQPPIGAGDIVTQGFNALPDQLSPIAWGRYLRATPALMRPSLVPQIAAWLGLLALYVCATRVLSGSRERQLENAPCSESLQRCD